MDGFNTRRKRNIDLSHLRESLPQTNMDWENEEVVELEEDYEEVEMELDNDEYEEEYEDEEVDVDVHVDVGVDESSEEVVTKSNQWSDGDNGQDTQMFINGKPFVPKQIPKKQTFADTHIRITTYLEKNVHQIIRMLQDQGQIESIAKFVNDSIKEHLMNRYHNDN
jgi:hypothetical protein